MACKSVAAARLAGFVLLVLAGTVLIPGASAQTFAGRSPSASGNNGGQPELVDLSNRSDLVSGGDALVQVVLPNRVDPSTVRVSLDGKDVTSMFATRPNGAYEGVVTGLANGANDLMASMKKGPTVHLTITNHPSGGPVFAGPQVQPWICATVAGFPAPTDAQCDGTPIVSFTLYERDDAYVPGV